MEESHLKALSIFYPYYLERTQAVERENIKFVQYTSADAAMNIIKNNEIWLRNSQCMNDFSEVKHGLNCLVTAFKDEDNGKRFQATLENIFPGIIKEFTDLFDRWLPSFQDSTYIACVSEHLPEEDKYGRLSMWRAYGGDRSVALVLNRKPFLAETDVFHAYTNPVAYQDPDNFNQEFCKLATRVDTEKEFIASLGKQTTINWLFGVFKNIILCVKHPGFKEEREWRVVYNPDFKRSKYVTSSIESINGIPQEVHKIPLKDIPEGNFYGVTVPQFIERIIIGPNDHQIVLGKTFAKLLEEAGCENSSQKISYSGIPLR
jgi:hypothetical protein